MLPRIRAPKVNKSNLARVSISFPNPKTRIQKNSSGPRNYISIHCGAGFSQLTMLLSQNYVIRI